MGYDWPKVIFNCLLIIFSINRIKLTSIRSVLYFNFTKPISTQKVCVRFCPDRTIRNVNEYKNYTIANNISFCFYNVTPGVYDPIMCPKFPITLS